MREGVRITSNTVTYPCRSCGVEMTATNQEYQSGFCPDICDKCGEAVPFLRMYDSREVISRAAVVKMLREERDRLDAISHQYKAEGNARMSHLMRVRANTFDVSAYMVEMMQ